MDDTYQIAQLTDSPRSITSATIINPVDPPPPPTTPPLPQSPTTRTRTQIPLANVEMKSPSRSGILKKPRPDSLPLMENSAIIDFNKPTSATITNQERYKYLQRSNSSRTYDRPKSHKTSEHDDSIFYIRSEHRVLQHSSDDFYDSEQVINERRTTLLKADSETALAERKLSSFSIPERILEQTGPGSLSAENEETKPPDETVLQIEMESSSGSSKDKDLV